MKIIAEKRGVPTPQLAIRWLLSHKAVGSVIAGAKHPHQVQQNAETSKWELSNDEITQIDSLTE